VFAKSAFEDVSDLYTSRPYQGVAIICKKHHLFSDCEIDSAGNRTITIELFDCNKKSIHIICNVYMPYFESALRLIVLLLPLMFYSHLLIFKTCRIQINYL